MDIPKYGHLEKSVEGGSYHSVELATFVALGLPFRVLGLASAKLAEVLCRLGSCVGKELHFNPPKRFTWGQVD